MVSASKSLLPCDRELSLYASSSSSLYSVYSELDVVGMFAVIDEQVVGSSKVLLLMAYVCEQWKL